MDAEQVVSKIISDAQNQADLIKRQAAQGLASEQAKLDEQLADFDRQTQALAQKAAKDKKDRTLASARMQTAKDILAEKSVILQNVFEKAREQILTLDKDKYRALIAKLMVKAAQSGDEEVIIDKNEARIDQSLIEQVNRELGEKGKLKLSSRRENIKAGFILSQGRIKNNVSLEVMLLQAKEDFQIELAKELFTK